MPAWERHFPRLTRSVSGRRRAVADRCLFCGTPDFKIGGRWKNAMTHPAGIEIVLRHCPVVEMVRWLAEVTGPLGDAIKAGEATSYPSTRLGAVIMQPGMGWPDATSIWFNAPELPWPSAAACARIAARALGCTVVCDPGAEYPGVGTLSPVFLEVSADGELLCVPDF